LDQALYRRARSELANQLDRNSIPNFVRNGSNPSLTINNGDAATGKSNDELKTIDLSG
jgi:hypothetical protein